MRRVVFLFGIAVIFLGVGMTLIAEFIYSQRAPYFFCGLYTGIIGIILSVVGILKGEKPKKPLNMGDRKDKEAEFERGDRDHLISGWR